MPIMHVNGTKINYMQLGHKGPSKAGDLVMIHGLATNMAFWLQDFARAFAKHFRITLYDLRGHGRSHVTDSGYSPANQAQDLNLLLDELEIDHAHIMAHSFGGTVAMNLAIEEPTRVDSLVIADTHISCMRNQEAVKNWQTGHQIAQILADNGITLPIDDPYFGYKLLTQIARMRQDNIDIPEQLRPWVTWIFGQDNNSSAQKWLKLIDTTCAQDELLTNDQLSQARLSQIDLPILCMYGQKSQSIATGNFLKQIWPSAKYEIIQDAGHFFPRAKPEQVIKLCEYFWDDINRFIFDEVNRLAGAKT